MSQIQHMTESELLAIEQQLRCPSGEAGITMGEQMHASNSSMTLKGIKALGLQANDKVLEIGHGNCSHLSNILKAAPNLAYQGLEISETMYQEAQRLNASLMATHPVQFDLYNGTNIPFADHHFNKILSVNNIYFWEDASAFFGELTRVLAPGGTIVVAFAQKEFMQQLPFVKTAFALFGKDDVEQLIPKNQPFSTTFFDYAEEAKSKAGETVKRLYTVAKMERQ